jgi:hypothetical protein
MAGLSAWRIQPWIYGCEFIAFLLRVKHLISYWRDQPAYWRDQQRPRFARMGK